MGDSVRIAVRLRSIVATMRIWRGLGRLKWRGLKALLENEGGVHGRDSK